MKDFKGTIKIVTQAIGYGAERATRANPELAAKQFRNATASDMAKIARDAYLIGSKDAFVRAGMKPDGEKAKLLDKIVFKILQSGKTFMEYVNSLSKKDGIQAFTKSGKVSSESLGTEERYLSLGEYVRSFKS